MTSFPPLIIRADADTTMGTGHVMRCLALAREWQAQGGKAVFTGKIAAHSLLERISNEGFDFVDVGRSFPDPADLELMLSLIKKSGTVGRQWVVVDGYHFTADYVGCLRAAGARVLVIDDYVHHEQYQADLLLNQNFGSESLIYPVNPEAIMLADSKYVLLRNEFLREKRADSEVSTVAGHILVTLGGADPENFTLKVIEALDLLNLAELAVKIVIGSVNPHYNLIKKRMEHVSFKGELLTTVRNMAPLMTWADLALTAGGSTCWEFAFLGVPIIIFVVSENQLGVADGLDAAEAGLNCGAFHGMRTDTLAAKIKSLLYDKSRRQRMAQSGPKIVDGQGAMRVVREMLSLPFSLRPAREDDCRQLFEWANDPVIRNASFHSEAIGWEEHQTWFESRQADEKCLLWIIEDQEGRAAGQLRFDISGKKAVISISLSDSARNKGLGSKVIKAACRFIFNNYPISQVKALVKEKNRLSVRCFEKAGFTRRSIEIMPGVPAVLMLLDSEQC